MSCFQDVANAKRDSMRATASASEDSDIAADIAAEIWSSATHFQNLDSQASDILSLRRRISEARSADLTNLDWTKVVNILNTDDLADQSEIYDHNSGGYVYFIFFERSFEDDGNHLESALVLKINNTIMQSQSEFCANQIADALDIQIPTCRLLRDHNDDWVSCCSTLEKMRDGCSDQGRLQERATDLLDLLAETSSCLIFNVVPNTTSVSFDKFEKILEKKDHQTRTLPDNVFEKIGEMFVFDIIIRNPDRFPCRQMGWRGNPDNTLWDGTTVWAIDSSIPRQPPRIQRVSDKKNVEEVLRSALSSGEQPLRLLYELLGGNDNDLDETSLKDNRFLHAVPAFQRGVRRCIVRCEALYVHCIRQMLEMLTKMVSESSQRVMDFFSQEAKPGSDGILRNKDEMAAIRMISKVSSRATAANLTLDQSTA